jgi:ferrous-iron efflux pump FieF
MNDTSYRLNLSAGMASVGTALLLVALKTWALMATGSLAIAAALTDSALDLLVSCAGLLGIVYAAKPPDEDHAFGHSSVEDLFALGQAALVAASAGLIVWRALHRLGDAPPLESEATGIAVMAVSIAVTLALVTWQSRVAARTGSRIVAADRLHYISDLLPATGAMVALVASGQFGIHWLDPVLAMVACAVLLAGVRRIGFDAWDALMDRRADPNQIAQIERIIRTQPGVLGFHDLKTRRSGSRVFVQVHLELDGAQTLRAAHDIGAAVRHAVLAAMPESDVIIHKDPVATVA